MPCDNLTVRFSCFTRDSGEALVDGESGAAMGPIETQTRQKWLGCPFEQMSAFHITNGAQDLFEECPDPLGGFTNGNRDRRTVTTDLFH